MHVEFSTRGSLGPQFLPRMLVLASAVATSLISWFISDSAGMEPSGSIQMALLPVYGHVVAYMVNVGSRSQNAGPGKADGGLVPDRLDALEAEIAKMRAGSKPGKTSAGRVKTR